MEPDKLMTDISQEISAALKNMGQARTPEEKIMYSEIVKNLCESLGVFLRLVSEMGDMPMYDDDDADPF